MIEHKWNLFLELMRWAEGGSCRHDAILRYFGTQDIAGDGCGRCDVCRQLGDAEVWDREDAQLLVRKVLSGVARVHDRYGFAVVVKLLRGERDKRLAAAGLDSVPTFGVLGSHSVRWLSRVLARCVTAGWVTFSGDERPRILLTPLGTEVMKGVAPARVLLPPVADPRHSSAEVAPPRGRRAAAEATLELDGTASELFEALRAFRLGVAREQRVPPYVVASDRSLREIAVLRPSSVEELQRVHGIGPNKAERFGPALLDIVRRS